jgi:ABC-2 type transport system ATP-binding protein
MAPAIRIEHLTKDYLVGFWKKRPYRALDRLSLEVNTGEIFGFLGPNGAGKTTTLKLLMQLIFPSAGRAEILGRPVGDVAARQRIGYLPENPYFYDYLTAQELLQYFGRLFGYSGEEARKRADMLLDRVGIPAERRGHQLRKYSKGMIQRVGIAQALLNDPEIIFLDEPMSGLDPLGRRDVRALIMELRDQGRTVFFSSHILADAEALCSRVAVVANGRLAAAGALTDILAFQVRGWELVIADLKPEVLARIGPRIRQSTPIGAERYSLEIAAEVPPEQLLSELVATGAKLVSLNPVRDTLEDFFVRRVAEMGDGARPASEDGLGMQRPPRQQADREEKR